LWSIVVNDSTDTISQETKNAVEANWSIVMGQLNLTATNRLANTVLEYCINDKKIEILDILNRANFIRRLNKLEDIDEIVDSNIIKVYSDGSYRSDQATYDWIKKNQTNGMSSWFELIIKNVNALRNGSYNSSNISCPDNHALEWMNEIIQELKNKQK
jgi:hypothetical protein